MTSTHATKPYDWRDPDVNAHWDAVRAKIRAGQDCSKPGNPITDLESAKRQLARCERDAEEWREVIRAMEKEGK